MPDEKKYELGAGKEIKIPIPQRGGDGPTERVEKVVSGRERASRIDLGDG